MLQWSVKLLSPVLDSVMGDQTLPSDTYPSPRLSILLEDPADFGLFLAYMNERGAETEILFIEQVRQLADLAKSTPSDVLQKQLHRTYYKFLAENASMPLRHIDETAISVFRKQYNPESEVSLHSFLLVQASVKAYIEREFVDAFELAKVDMSPNSAGVSNSFHEIREDPERLQLFLLFLMKDSRHRMLLFWLELGDLEDSRLDKTGSERLVCLKSIYSKYVSSGVFGSFAESTHMDDGAFITNILEIHRKVGRLLRLEMWPQFCSSSLFLELLEKRENDRLDTLSETNSPSTGPRAMLNGFLSFKKKPKARYNIMSMFTKHTGQDVILAVPQTSSVSDGVTTLEYVCIVKGSFIAKRTDSNTFSCEIVQRYPNTDNNGFPLPSNIELFAFPDNIGSITSPDSIGNRPKKAGRLRQFNFVVADSGCYGASKQIVVQGSSDVDSSTYAVCLITQIPLVSKLRGLLNNFHSTWESIEAVSDSKSFQDLICLTNQPYSRDVPIDEHRLPSYNLSSPLVLKHLDFDFSALFKLMHPYKVLSVLEYLLLEKKVLLVSSQLSLLTIAGETFRELMFPFQFQFLYTTVLPKPLLDALQCPTPFLIGIHSSLKDQALRLEQIRQDLYVVDLDYDSVNPAYIVDRPFPRGIRASFLDLFRRESFGYLVDIDYCTDSGVSSGSSDRAIRKQIIHLWMNELIPSIQNFLIIVPDAREDKPPLLVFDAPAFYKERPNSHHPFLKAFFQTAAFSNFLCSLIAGDNIERIRVLGDYRGGDENFELP